MSDKPQVWVGCLGCYNAGTLTGEWFDAIDCPTDMAAFNKAIGFDPTSETWERGPDAARQGPNQARSTRVAVSQDHGHPVYGPHEELWVMDFENFEGLLSGECSPVHAQQLAQKMAEHEDLELPAFAAWVSSTYGSSVEPGDLDSRIEEFGEKFAGRHSSLTEWAWSHLEDTGYFHELPAHMEDHKGAIVDDWLAGVEGGGEINTEKASDGDLYIWWS